MPPSMHCNTGPPLILSWAGRPHGRTMEGGRQELGGAGEGDLSVAQKCIRDGLSLAFQQRPEAYKGTNRADVK